MLAQALLVPAHKYGLCVSVSLVSIRFVQIDAVRLASA